MSNRFSATKRIRKNFGKIRKIVDIPDLIGMQRESFARFLQMDIPPEERGQIESLVIWPSALVAVMDIMFSIQGLAVVVLVGAVVAQEYTWKTYSLWLSHGTPRLIVLASKFAALMVATFLMILIPLLVGGTLSAFFTVSVTGVLDPSHVDFGQLSLGLMRMAYVLLPYIALTFLLAILSRSTVVAIGGSVAFTLIIENIMAQIMTLLGGVAAKIAQYLPTMLAQSIMSLNINVAANAMSVSVNGSQIIDAPQFLDPNLAALYVGLYTIVLLGLSIWVFQRQDMTT